jgi:hypothetical protein
MLAGRALAEDQLLQVSDDPTREFSIDLNDLVVAHWKEAAGKDVELRQPHGGLKRHSPRPARGRPLWLAWPFAVSGLYLDTLKVNCVMCPPN